MTDATYDACDILTYNIKITFPKCFLKLSFSSCMECKFDYWFCEFHKFVSLLTDATYDICNSFMDEKFDKWNKVLNYDNGSPARCTTNDSNSSIDSVMLDFPKNLETTYEPGNNYEPEYYPFAVVINSRKQIT